MNEDRREGCERWEQACQSSLRNSSCRAKPYIGIKHTMAQPVLPREGNLRRGEAPEASIATSQETCLVYFQINLQKWGVFIKEQQKSNNSV